MVVGVVGSVGTAEGEERALKRKREAEEEPGAAVPPSNKKRHIRLRSRVQVSASTSQAPDTQGSSMAKVREPQYNDYFETKGCSVVVIVSPGQHELIHVWLFCKVLRVRLTESFVIVGSILVNLVHWLIRVVPGRLGFEGSKCIRVPLSGSVHCDAYASPSPGPGSNSEGPCLWEKVPNLYWSYNNSPPPTPPHPGSPFARV